MVRRFDYRLDVVKNGVAYEELRAVEPPSLLGDNSTDIETSMSATVIPNDNIDILNDYIRPVAIIDGTEHPLGLYCIARREEQTGDNGEKWWSIEAYDRCWILEQTKVETHYVIDRNEPIVTAISALLTQAGIATVRATPSALVMPYTLEWQIGTSYLEIINALLAIINYDKLFFDFNGYAVVQPYVAPNADNISHTFDGTNDMSIIARSNTKIMDIFNVPNVFIATCASPDSNTTLNATAVNDVPTSELSILRRGRRIVKVIKVDTIADQATLQDYVEKIRNEYLFTSEQISVTTAIIPDIAVNQTIAIHHPDIDGLFREKSWSIGLSVDGQMTHTLQRMVIV